MTTPTPRVSRAWAAFWAAVAGARLEDHMLQLLLLGHRGDAVPPALIDAIHRIAEKSHELAFAAEEYANALSEQERKPA